MHMKVQKTSNSQNNPEQKKNATGITISVLKFTTKPWNKIAGTKPDTLING